MCVYAPMLLLYGEGFFVLQQNIYRIIWSLLPSPSTLPIGVLLVRSGLLPQGLRAPNGLDKPAVTKVSSSESRQILLIIVNWFKMLSLSLKFITRKIIWGAYKCGKKSRHVNSTIHNCKTWQIRQRHLQTILLHIWHTYVKKNSWNNSKSNKKAWTVNIFLKL